MVSVTAGSSSENLALTMDDYGPDWHTALRWQDLNEDEQESIMSQQIEEGYEAWEIEHARFWRLDGLVYFREACGGDQ